MLHSLHFDSPEFQKSTENSQKIKQSSLIGHSSGILKIPHFWLNFVNTSFAIFPETK